MRIIQLLRANSLERRQSNPLALAWILVLSLCSLILTASPSLAQAPAKPESQLQSQFASPDEAMQALIAAANAKDQAALAKIFAPDYDQLLSGDEVEDTKDLDDFRAAVQESAQVKKVDDSKYAMVIGAGNWPLPIPIVQQKGQWLFDTKAGLDEILNRRIGENELSAIQTCRVYAVAQWEYFTEGDWDHDGVAEYAQRLYSSPGKHDGLYWETVEDEKPSPLGKLVAAARAEGYGPKDVTQDAAKGGGASDAFPEERAPYHGYYFKILTRQGSHAPGGKYSYIINGNMIAGYAFVAYPDKWGSSGVMTFIVNQQGRVYEKNLGPNTAKIAPNLAAYDPDPTWKLVPPEQ